MVGLRRFGSQRQGTGQRGRTRAKAFGPSLPRVPAPSLSKKVSAHKTVQSLAVKCEQSGAMTEMDGVIREHEAKGAEFLSDKWLLEVMRAGTAIPICMKVYFATLAEQAERYDEMAEHMRAVGT